MAGAGVEEFTLDDALPGTDTIFREVLPVVLKVSPNTDVSPAVPADNSEKKRKRNELIRFGLTLGFRTTLYPFDYAKTLMQLGFEPLPATPGQSFFGKPILLLPNILQYTNHIRKVDGFTGCFTGLTPQLMGLVVSKLVNRHLVETVGLKADSTASEETGSYEHFKKTLKREIILSTAGVLAMHPFRVITIRMMARFIGQEEFYTSVSDSIKEIFQTEGLTGFFSGLVPRLFWDVGCVVLTSSAVYLFNKHVARGRFNSQLSLAIQCLSCNVLYPLYVTATCMSVSGSTLAAGNPPLMPSYGNWIYCLKDLYDKAETKRGSSMFMRSANKMLIRNHY